MEEPARHTPSGQDEEEQVLLSAPHEEPTYTVEQAIEQLGFGAFQMRLLAIAGVAWMADSMEMAVLAILGPAVRCEWNLTHWHEAFLTTVVFIGMFLSTYFWGYVSDKYGRKRVLIMATAGVFYYGLLSTFSPRYSWILLLRGMVGFSMSGVVQGTNLIAEYLPIKARGLTINLSSLFWSAGTCFEVFLAMFVMPKHGWRWQLFISSLPSLIFILVSRHLAESVRFFAASGDVENVKIMLGKVAHQNGRELPPGRLKIVHQASLRGDFCEMFRGNQWKTTIPLWIIWFGSHFNIYGLALLATALYTGGNTCYGSSPPAAETLENCQFCKSMTFLDYLHFLYVLLADFAGVFIVAIMADTAGRKALQALGFVMMAFFFSLLFICTHSKMVTTAILFGVRCFAAVADIGGYIYTPEVYPTHIRGIALGSCSGISRIGCMLTPFVAQVLSHHSLHTALGIYLVVSVSGFISCILLPIETKGRALTDIDGKPLS